MNSSALKTNQQTLELKNLRLLCFLSLFLLITDYIMPQYFGLHLGYDLTCTRLANLLIIGYFILNGQLLTHFWKTILRCEITVPAFLYLLVCLYTMLLRADVNALFMVLFEMLTLYMLVYLVRYVIGYTTAIRIGIVIAYILGVIGFIDYALRQSVFLKFLRTMNTPVTNVYRSGQYRIMGPCGHPLAYGLFLILLIALACIDYEKNEVNLLKRPLLLVLLMANVFLTGSRSTLAIAVVEVLVIFLLCNANRKKHILFQLLVLIIVVGSALFVLRNTSIGRYILMQITSVIDEIFGTEYAVYFGADTTRLENSTEYRKMLPYVFKLEWLNPILGRGVKRGFGAEINGVFIESIDNYYVSQYIKYAYPGMVTYILFIVTTAVAMLRYAIKYRSAICTLLLVGTVCYYYNLWWLDALQTLKYEYIIIAIFYAYVLSMKDGLSKERKIL